MTAESLADMNTCQHLGLCLDQAPAEEDSQWLRAGWTGSTSSPKFKFMDQLRTIHCSDILKILLFLLF